MSDDPYMKLLVEQMMFMRYQRPVEVIIKNVVDCDPESALEELERTNPDEYALLMEHLPIERSPRTDEANDDA